MRQFPVALDANVPRALLGFQRSLFCLKKSICGDLNPRPLGLGSNSLPTALIRFVFGDMIVVVGLCSRADPKAVDAVSNFTKLCQ